MDKNSGSNSTISGSSSPSRSSSVTDNKPNGGNSLEAVKTGRVSHLTEDPITQETVEHHFVSSEQETGNDDASSSQFYRRNERNEEKHILSDASSRFERSELSAGSDGKIEETTQSDLSEKISKQSLNKQDAETRSDEIEIKIPQPEKIREHEHEEYSDSKETDLQIRNVYKIKSCVAPADHKHCASRSPSRSNKRCRQRNRSTSRARKRTRSATRSISVDRSNVRLNSYDRKSRRSASIERRCKERKRRHADLEKLEESKRNSSKKRQEAEPTSSCVKSKRQDDNETVTDPKAKITERQRRTVDLLTSRTGGAYIPPAKLRLMQQEITDKSSAAYQRIAWEALKKSIHGYINKVNVDNIAIITRELLKENIVRGRGLLCRSIIQAQAASPTFTHVYAALVAIINSKFPNIGELLLKRLILQFRRAFRRNDKAMCLSSSRFIAHLVNQRVSHEILALEILTLLVETPTDDSVEVAIAFLRESGMKLTEVSSKGIGAIFEMLKNILHEGKLDKRVQYMIEVVFQVRKDGFKDHQAVLESLELVEEDDQFTHLLMLDDATDPEDILNAFKFDEMYATNEDKYTGLSKEILGSDDNDSGDSSGSGTKSDSESDDSDSNVDSGEKNEGKATTGDIIDNTETNLIALRRTIYLTINSSLDYEECAHKLMKMQLKPGQEIELCHMFLDCCAEQRTYEKFYGLLAQRFCAINKIYIEPFEEIFKDTYQTTHRLDTNRLRNVSKFFAHLLFTDAIGWDVLDCIKLNEDDTTSSSRIFIKILFQELAEYMGLGRLNNKLKGEGLAENLAGLFPKDNPRNTRFAINFFTSIGLGGLTDDLRQFLKSAPKAVPAINVEILGSKAISDIKPTSSSLSSHASSLSSTSSGSSSASTSSSSSSSTSSSIESDSEAMRKKKRKRTKMNKRSHKKVSKKDMIKKTKLKSHRDKNKNSTSKSSESRKLVGAKKEKSYEREKHEKNESHRKDDRKTGQSERRDRHRQFESDNKHTKDDNRKKSSYDNDYYSRKRQHSQERVGAKRQERHSGPEHDVKKRHKNDQKYSDEESKNGREHKYHERSKKK